jgi:hypothetical protein
VAEDPEWRDLVLCRAPDRGPRPTAGDALGRRRRYVFETADDARAAYRRSRGASSQPHAVTRTREGGTIGVSLGINVAGEAYSSVGSVFRNVLSFSVGGGVVPSYTKAEAGRDGVRNHRAIHRRAIALSS